MRRSTLLLISTRTFISYYFILPRLIGFGPYILGILRLVHCACFRKMTTPIILPPTEEPHEFNTNYIFYWNNVGLELNRLTHSVGGPQTGPTASSRALALLHLAINDAYFAIKPNLTQPWTYLTQNNPDPAYRLPDLSGATDERSAVAGAARTVLTELYTESNAGFPTFATNQLSQLLQRFISDFPNVDVNSPSYKFGVAVGRAILNLLEIKPTDPELAQGNYRPSTRRYRFRDDPTHPVHLVPVDPNNPTGPQKAVQIYHAPFYGAAKRISVQLSVDGTPTEHLNADPPVNFGVKDKVEYEDSLRDITRSGGKIELNSTRRRPDQTAAGYYWAYDGTNLIGTPPRFYNQIIRQIAWNKKQGGATSDSTNAEFARLFALVNAALGDAAIFAWREKYFFEFWRPITGVRLAEEGPLLQDPFWLPLGSPNSNTNLTPFTPNFPAYPSGHATFGGACFQTVRLFYKNRDKLAFSANEPDNISFSFVSDELNGISRDLDRPYDPTRRITDQPGTLRTRVVRSFPSLWATIFDNAVSRVWLGVHWRFDAFAANDTLVKSYQGNEPYGSPYRLNPDGTTAYKDPADIRYTTTGTRADRPAGQQFPIGGVPLGIEIANDIFGGNLKPTPPQLQPTPLPKPPVRQLDQTDLVPSPPDVEPSVPDVQPNLPDIQPDLPDVQSNPPAVQPIPPHDSTGWIYL